MATTRTHMTDDGYRIAPSPEDVSKHWTWEVTGPGIPPDEPRHANSLSMANDIIESARCGAFL